MVCGNCNNTFNIQSGPLSNIAIAIYISQYICDTCHNQIKNRIPLEERRKRIKEYSTLYTCIDGCKNNNNTPKQYTNKTWWNKHYKATHPTLLYLSATNQK